MGDGALKKVGSDAEPDGALETDREVKGVVSVGSKGNDEVAEGSAEESVATLGTQVGLRAMRDPNAPAGVEVSKEIEGSVLESVLQGGGLEAVLVGLPIEVSPGTTGIGNDVPAPALRVGLSCVLLPVGVGLVGPFGRYVIEGPVEGSVGVAV